MPEHMNKQTRSLSRQTVQWMLELKGLLRHYDITIALGVPDAYDQLIQAAAVIDDAAITDLRLRLIEAGEPNVSQGEQKPPGNDTPRPDLGENVPEARAMTPSPPPNHCPIREWKSCL